MGDFAVALVPSSWIWCYCRPSIGVSHYVFFPQIAASRLSDDACLCNISMFVYLFCVYAVSWNHLAQHRDRRWPVVKSAVQIRVP
jgi:hypothetical protein